MLNRALSHRAIKKYRKAVLGSIRRSIFSKGEYTYRDLYIPRKHKDGIAYRYYHFFSLAQLEKLCAYSGFVVDTCMYIDTTYDLTTKAKHAQNSLLIAQKSVY